MVLTVEPGLSRGSVSLLSIGENGCRAKTRSLCAHAGSSLRGSNSASTSVHGKSSPMKSRRIM
jgi:hypothetical protein